MSVRLIFLMLLSLFFLHFSCANFQEEPWKYTDVSRFKKNKRVYALDQFMQKNPKAVKLESFLPKIKDTKARVDYTAIIQNVINTNRAVVFPEFPLLINEKGLDIPSNSRLFFFKKSKLILKPNALGQYEMIRIHDCNDIEIYNPTLIGDREQHLSDSGEWGMGISIRGAKNISLFGSSVSQCWGDGIYLGVTESMSNNININIVDSFLDFNRRNGMSIIAGQNVNVNRLCVTNTSGTPPFAGVDIEPDKPSDVIQNLSFENVISLNNKDHGFLIVLSNLYGFNQKNVNIAVKNLKVEKSNYGLSLKLGNENDELVKPMGSVFVDNVSVKKIKVAKYLSYDENVNCVFDLKMKLAPQERKNLKAIKKSFANVKNVKIFGAN